MSAFWCFRLFGDHTTKLSANYLSSPTKVFHYAYDGNPDVYPLEKFDHAACDVCHLGSCFYRPSCSRSYHGGKSTLNYYRNSDASFHLNYFKVCGDVHPNPGPTTANKNPKQSTDSTKSRKARVWKCPCSLCLKPVRANQKGILCDICNRWHHIKYLNMDPTLYMALILALQMRNGAPMTVQIHLILQILSSKRGGGFASSIQRAASWELKTASQKKTIKKLKKKKCKNDKN